jgi:hypothetical protein
MPCFGGLIMVVRGSQQLMDKVDITNIAVVDMKDDIKQIKADFKQLHTQVDTISHRQELNQVKQEYRYQLERATQAHPHIQWMEERYRSK